MPTDDLVPTRDELLDEAEAYARAADQNDNIERSQLADAYLAGLNAGTTRALATLRKAVGMAPMPAPGSEVVQ